MNVSRHRPFVLFLLLATFAGTAAASAARHDLRVAVDPDGRSIEVDDIVSLPPVPEGRGGRVVHFLLHAGLEPKSPTEGVKLARLDRKPAGADFGIPEDRFRLPSSVPLELWKATLRPEIEAFALSYGGTIDHPVAEAAGDYARSFGETPGLVTPAGVFLAGSTVWVPWLGEEPFAFTLECLLPSGWDAVSQGKRTVHDRRSEGTTVVWDSPEPQTEVYLAAARFVETSRSDGKIEAMAFLRSKDEALASKYLDATERYVRMYEDLLGPYPYPKFALVENFWETGYGMPSFTLLGSKVIRLPFLLNSSYPHEILHNWWGNGVFVDPARGNWCEGLTAYLADHLLQEQGGDASEYRLTTLQKYADYVSKEKDFPLSAFRERHSPSTEAVGYGKALMFFHELRRELGDEVFTRALREFYAAHRFRSATFDDLRRAFENASGRDLSVRFAQVLDRGGAPALALRNTVARPDGDRFVVEGTIEQVQPGEPFALRVPVVVTTEGKGRPSESFVDLAGRSASFRIEVSAKPARVDVDPSFDLFRRLDPSETPPALTRAFGAEKALVLLPSAAPEAERAAYRALAEEWARAEPGRVEIREDREVAAPPADRAIWIFGSENARVAWLAEGVRPYGAAWDGKRLRVGDHEGVLEGIAAAIVGPHPASSDLVVAWVFADRPLQLAGLGRKLPHYHKYSYVVFEGDEPANVAKGRWPVLDSPLAAVWNAGEAKRPPAPRRAPLASPPAPFSTERIRRTVAALAAPEMEGRAPGTAGHERAAAFVEREMRDAGLAPAGEGSGTFAATWVADAGSPTRRLRLRNLLGKVSGTKPELANQVVVVGAHYDHLGDGWPEARAGNEGKIHPGADDNASGVAALLELARAFAAGSPPDRTILFAAFDGEEAGRLGSKRLVESLGREGTTVHAMVNLDSVGRLGAGKILVLGTATATEWVHVFRGAGFVTGAPVESVATDPGGSDQVSFQERGIPAVQLFTGAHPDYHAPTDTADKIDADGIAKVAAVAREAVEYLAGRIEPLTASAGRAPGSGDAGGSRKVSLGTVPDFAFGGEGVRLSGVAPGSPAERAGLAQGDVIVALGESETPNLRSFSEALERLDPGARVVVHFVRDGVRRTVEAEIVGR
jgi:hypothetical protein